MRQNRTYLVSMITILCLILGRFAFVMPVAEAATINYISAASVSEIARLAVEAKDSGKSASYFDKQSGNGSHCAWFAYGYCVRTAVAGDGLNMPIEGLPERGINYLLRNNYGTLYVKCSDHHKKYEQDVYNHFVTKSGCDGANVVIANSSNFSGPEAGDLVLMAWEDMGYAHYDHVVVMVSSTECVYASGNTLYRNPMSELVYPRDKEGKLTQFKDDKMHKYGDGILAYFRFNTSSTPVNPLPRKDVLSGVYVIHSAYNDNMCLDIAGNSLDNNANIQLYHRIYNNVQKFRIIKWTDEYYCIKSVYNGRWLDVALPVADNANVKLYNTNTGDENHWYFEDAGDGYVYIKNMCGYYLDVFSDNPVDNGNIQVYHYVGNKSQKWRLEDVTDYYNLADGIYSVSTAIDDTYRLDIAGNSSEVNANIQLYQKLNSDVQRFRFVKHGNYYTIQSVYSGYWFDIKLPITNKSNVKLWNGDYEEENHWVLEDAGNGYVFIRSNADFYLDVEGDAARNNANIQVYRHTGIESQKWKISAADYQISYEANGGSGAPGPQSKIYNVNTSLSNFVPIRAGYVFAGWKETSGGTGSLYMPGSIYSTDADVVLSAQWVMATELNIPDSTITIDEEAFKNVSANKIMIPSTAEYIGPKAFSNNSHLCAAYFSSSTVKIESGAFSNCPLLIIYAPPGSTAEVYAGLNHIPFVAIPE